MIDCGMERYSFLDLNIGQSIINFEFRSMNRRQTDVKKDTSRQSETNLVAQDKSVTDVAQKPEDAAAASSRPRPDQIDTGKKKVKKDRKRIMVTGVNSLVGHSLFEQMRNDHLNIYSGKKAHKFTGTLIQADKETVPVPSTSIKILDHKKKPKTFGRSVVKSDVIIIDLLSGADYEEAEQAIQILRQPLQEQQNRKQTLIVISSVFSWACTPLESEGEVLDDQAFQRRVPLPRYQ